MGGRGYVWIGLLAACQETSSFYVDPPWPPDRVVVLVEHNADDAPVAVKVYAPGDPIIIPTREGQRVGLTAIIYQPTERADIDPVRCGVKLDATNPIALVAEGAYYAPVGDWALNPGPEFLAIDPAMIQLPIGYSMCTSDAFDCSTLDLETIPTIHANGKIQTLAAASDDLVFYGASMSGETVAGDVALYRAMLPKNGVAEHRRLPLIPEVTHRAKSLAFDGSVILGRTDNAIAFTSTLDGTLSYTASIAGYRGVASYAGLTFEFGGLGIRCITGSVAPLAAPTLSMAIIGPDRIAAATDSGIQFWDGTRWSVEYPLNSGRGWRVGGDSEALVAIQTDGTVLERNDQTRTWAAQGTPLGAFTDLKVVAGMGAGRWLIAGQDGVLAIKLAQGGRICRATVVGANNYETMARSPSGRTLWLAMSPNSSVVGDLALLVRIAVP